MSKIVGFNTEVAKKAVDNKRIDQRKASSTVAGRNIHFVKGYNLANPVLKERV